MKDKICAGGFVYKDDKFLFGKRSERKTWAPELWDIPGGKAEKNENIFATLKREIFEETGISVLEAELLTTITIEGFSKKQNFQYFIYGVTKWQGIASNCSNEHTEIHWFTREQLENISLALPQYLSMIDKWKGKS